MSRIPWRDRIARAGRLADSVKGASELLRFYQALLVEQEPWCVPGVLTGALIEERFPCLLHFLELAAPFQAIRRPHQSPGRLLRLGHRLRVGQPARVGKVAQEKGQLALRVEQPEGQVARVIAVGQLEERGDDGREALAGEDP